jgi:hypothetical protein
MRASFSCFFFLLIVFPLTTHCEEIIPGVVSFDAPRFLVSHSPKTVTNLDVPGEIRQFSAIAAMGSRIINIRIKDAGSSLRQDKVDYSALRTLMQTLVDSTRNATNISKVAESKVGGKRALCLSYQVVQRHWAENPNAVFSFEVYWVIIQTNRILEIKLMADSPEHLDTLKPCLTKFRIHEGVVH